MLHVAIACLTRNPLLEVGRCSLNLALCQRSSNLGRWAEADLCQELDKLRKQLGGVINQMKIRGTNSDKAYVIVCVVTECGSLCNCWVSL